ncbi:MAG: putative Zn peptidase [Streptosporangiaceae bacterium]|nr:putative Zn peptidase [Streptosporangiaceae bacterium]
MSTKTVADMNFPEIRAAADEMAHEILDEFWPHRFLPVDPVEIARDMGVEVFSAELGNDVFGLIYGGPGGAQIYIDQDQPPNRYRFTVAHELGHYVEHSEGPGAQADINYVDRRSDEDRGQPEEVYANQFAGALLMPEQELREARARGLNDVQLARLFGVSLSALQYRLQLLKA